jgi:hypothetical protein
MHYMWLFRPLASWCAKAELENTGRHIIVRAALGVDVQRLRARDGAEWQGDAP